MSPDEQSTQTTSSPAPTASQTVPVSGSSIGLKELLIPISIAIAGAFIGIGLFFGGGQNGMAPNPLGANNPQAPTEAEDKTGNIAPVTAEDWIKGNPDAPIKIVEFSDYDCPFCSRFHDTMNQIVEASNGEVAWVYRHFPLEQLHPQAPGVALAAECVGALGGNEAFWQFSDSYFEARGAGDGTAHGELIPKLVTQTGVDQGAFIECFENETYAGKVNSHINQAVETGGRGTPWSILIAPDGSTYPINGAQPQTAIEQLINFAQQGG